jgi:transmembrane sensor
VTINYSLRERDVWLPHGEASFHVAHESDRPFLVRAGHHHRFQAVGTEFNVRVLTDENVELIVTEGSVTLFEAPEDRPETPAVARLRDNMIHGDTTVDAFQQVQVEPGLQFVRKIDAGEAKDLLAWQRGRIIFKGERLEDALMQMGRYTNTRFVLANAELGDIRVAGDFRTGDMDEFLLSLRKNYLIVSQRAGNGRIVLRPFSRPDSRL